MSPTRTRSRRALATAKPPSALDQVFRAHHLVPPHELLSEEEGQRVLRELATSVERLPKILATDPGLRTDRNYVTAREARTPMNGRIVRIRRPSATAGEAVAYRVLAQSVEE